MTLKAIVGQNGRDLFVLIWVSKFVDGIRPWHFFKVILGYAFEYLYFTSLLDPLRPASDQ